MHDWLTIELVLGVLLVTSFTCVGLLALWAATSPRHWFVRTAAVLAALSPLLLVPAYEPFLVFVLQTAIVALGVSISRWRQKRRNSSQSLSVRFSLGSFLLATVLIAIAVVIATKLPELNAYAWITIVLMGISAGVATLVGAWMFSANRKLIAWPVGFLLCLFLGAILAYTDWFVPSCTSFIVGWPPTPDVGASSLLGISVTRPVSSWFFVLPLVGLFLMLLLFCRKAAFPAQGGGNNNSQLSSHTVTRHWFAKGVLFATIALVAYFPFAVLGKLLTPDPLPDVTLPNPNGYDDFLAAGRIADLLPVNGRGNFDWSTAAQAALAPEVAKCNEVYDKVAHGLGVACCRVPVHYSGGADSLPLDGIQSLRAVSRAMAAKARLAQLEGRIEDAAKTNIDLMRLGHAIRHGGLLIDGMVGVACTRMGLDEFNQVRSGLSSSAASQCVKELLQIDSSEEPYEDMWHRDRVWAQRANGWHGHLQQILDDLTTVQQTIPILFLKPREFQFAFFVPRAINRLVICDMALARFHEATGSWPESLTELIPAYLSELPIDPLDPDERPLKYRRDGDSCLLYSIGLNGVDDGGNAPDPDDEQSTPRTGDLRLDVYFAPDPNLNNPLADQNTVDSIESQPPTDSPGEAIQ